MIRKTSLAPSGSCEICAHEPAVRRAACIIDGQPGINVKHSHTLCWDCEQYLINTNGRSPTGRGVPRCPERVTDADRVLLALRRDPNSRPPLEYEMIGGPANGEVMCVDRDHTEVVVPVDEPISARDIGAGKIPMQQPRRAIYKRVRRRDAPNGYVFICQNEKELNA